MALWRTFDSRWSLGPKPLVSASSKTSMRLSAQASLSLLAQIRPFQDIGQVEEASPLKSIVEPHPAMVFGIGSLMFRWIARAIRPWTLSSQWSAGTLR